MESSRQEASEDRVDETYWEGCLLVERRKHTLRAGEKRGSAVFVHGWPDSPVLFDTQVRALRPAGYDCVLITLPYFGDSDPPASAIGDAQERLSLDAAATALVNVLEHTKQSDPSKPVVLVCHDWGCVISYLAHERCMDRALVSSLVALDVGIGIPPQRGILAKLFLALYMPALALAHWIGGRFGDGFAQLVARSAHTPRDPSTVTARMCWPYLDAIHSRALLRRSLSNKKYPPQGVPVLFLYGRKSPLRYFDERWTRRVLATHVFSEVQPVESDHWFVTRSRTRDSVAQTILAWLEKLPPSPSL